MRVFCRKNVFGNWKIEKVNRKRKKLQFVLCELHFLCYTVTDINDGGIWHHLLPVNQFLFLII